MLRVLVVAACLLMQTSVASAQIERIWLSHKRAEPSRVVVNWETAQPAPPYRLLFRDSVPPVSGSAVQRHYGNNEYPSIGHLVNHTIRKSIHQTSPGTLR